MTIKEIMQNYDEFHCNYYMSNEDLCTDLTEENVARIKYKDKMTRLYEKRLAKAEELKAKEEYIKEKEQEEKEQKELEELRKTLKNLPKFPNNYIIIEE